MGKIVKERKRIEKIDADFVRKNWMTTDFMKFVWEFATKDSHDRRTMIPRLMVEGTNVVHLVTPSDTSWAITCSLNNDTYWPWLLKNEWKDPNAPCEDGFNGCR